MNIKGKFLLDIEGDFDDNPENDIQTLRFCVEQDLEDNGFSVINIEEILDIEDKNIPEDVILDQYNNLMICPECKKSIGTAFDWTPNYCKECGKKLSGGNIYNQ